MNTDIIKIETDIVLVDKDGNPTLSKELKGRGLCNASVILAAGLPIKWLGEQGEAFRKYLLRNKEVTFRCNDTRCHVKIEDVEVYAQGFAAVAADLSSYQGFNIVADIGNGTMNVIFIVDGKPNSRRYNTERFGVEVPESHSGMCVSLYRQDHA